MGNKPVRISHENYFTLRNWVQANHEKVRVLRLDKKEVVALIKKEVALDVSPNTLDEMTTTLAIKPLWAMRPVNFSFTMQKDIRTIAQELSRLMMDLGRLPNPELTQIAANRNSGRE